MHKCDVFEFLHTFSRKLMLSLYALSQKNKTLYSCSQLPQMLTDFQNSFTVRLIRKFVTRSYLNTPPHTKRVATVLCEISMRKISNAQEVTEATAV